MFGLQNFFHVEAEHFVKQKNGEKPQEIQPSLPIVVVSATWVNGN